MKISSRRTITAVLVALCLSSVAAMAQIQEAKPTSPAEQVAPVEQPKPPVPAEQPENAYIIGESDVLAINVWHEPELTRTVPVRTDGKITLPLIGELQAAGQTVDQLRSTIATNLKRFLEAPEVTVIVQEPRSQFFTVVGKVVKPGSYPLGQRLTVMDGLALSGGFKDFAKVNKIQVVRTHRDGRVERLPFDYKRALAGDLNQNFVLEQHDMIVVP
jgi:polysaccharide export outer membrane protein